MVLNILLTKSPSGWKCIFFFNLVPRDFSLAWGRGREKAGKSPWERGCFFFLLSICSFKIYLIILDVLLCSIAEYFCELCSPYGLSKYIQRIMPSRSNSVSMAVEGTRMGLLRNIFQRYSRICKCKTDLNSAWRCSAHTTEQQEEQLQWTYVIC